MKLEERKRLSTTELPVNAEGQIREELLRMAHRQEEVMYEKEFPGHPLPPFPDYFLPKK